MTSPQAGSTPAPQTMRLQAVFNRIVSALLRSPLHGIMSEHILLLSFTGRRSGARRMLPISYLQQGALVSIFTDRRIVWWRNLQGGAAVTLWLRGSAVPGRASVVMDNQPLIRQRLAAFLRHNHTAGRFYQVPFNAAGEPDPAALARAAERSVLIEIDLD